MPWTDSVPKELVEKLEAKNAVCIYRRGPDFWIAPERDLRLDNARRAPMRGEAGGRAFREVGRDAAVTEASAGPSASV
jgi:hypothetical protein